MSNNELSGSQSGESQPTPQRGELAASAEIAVAGPRFVVYGSRVSGAYVAANAFERHLAELGFGGADVVAVRDAARIKDAFYDRQAAAEADPEPVSMWRRAVNTLLQWTTEQPAGKPPKGVVVFPEMRQYNPNGSGMFIPAPRDFIAELCADNNVPVVFVEDLQTPAEFEAAVSAFALKPNQE